MAAALQAGKDPRHLLSRRSPIAKRTQTDSNRVYRRVVIQDYGKPIYKASSRIAMLTALEGYIEGYESHYRQTGMIQSDISLPLEVYY